MKAKPPSLSIEARRKIRATDKRARLALRKRLIERWRSAASPNKTQTTGQPQPDGVLLDAVAFNATPRGGISPGRRPEGSLTAFEKEAYAVHPYTPDAWEQAWERYGLTCFDVRAKQYMEFFQSPDEFLKFLQSTIVPEVMGLIEGPLGLWPSLMIVAHEAAGFYVNDSFRTFFHIVFRLDVKALRNSFMSRAEVWECRHLERATCPRRKNSATKLKPLPSSKPTLTTSEAAQVLGVSERQIRKLVANNKLDTVGDGHHKRVTSKSVEKYLGCERNVERHGTKRNQTELLPI